MTNTNTNTNTNTKSENNRELVRNITSSIIKNNSPYHAIGTLEALLYMAISELPEPNQSNYLELVRINTITHQLS